MIDLLRPQVMGAAVGALAMGFLSGLGIGTVVAGPAPANTTPPSTQVARGSTTTPLPTLSPGTSPTASESRMPCEHGSSWRPIDQPEFVLGIDLLQPSGLAGALHADTVAVDVAQVTPPSTGAKAFEDAISNKARDGEGVVLMRLGRNQREGAVAAARRYSNLWFVLLVTDDAKDREVDLSEYPARTVAVRIGGDDRETARLDPVSQVPNVVHILKDEVSCVSVTKGSST